MNKALQGRKSRNRQVYCINLKRNCACCLLSSKVWQPIFVNDTIDAQVVANDPTARVLLVKLDTSDALPLVEYILHKRPDMKAIALLEPNQLENTHIADGITQLFFDYLTCPVQTDMLHHVLGHAEGMASLCAHRLAAKQPPSKEQFSLMGESFIMQSVKSQLMKISQSNAPIMISGESGTGKELAAQTIHNLSSRKAHKFTAVNMAAIPEHLIQSELFGHEKGAFTGADKVRKGLIESAEGGTLFLDEIGDMPLQQQANLLRFLQEGIITRVGGTDPIAINVRVITATHVDLEKAVNDGNFREDLFYRLNVLQLDMPPLRSRGQDILTLADQFLHQYNQQNPCHTRCHFAQSTRKAITAHHWPGNVRELMNRIQRAVTMCSGKLITTEDLGLEPATTKNTITTLAQAKKEIEIGLVSSTLRETKNNISATAKLLGISRVTLYKLVAKHRLEHLYPTQNA
ncbi:MAG TPA: sigma-54-dependent Fis family transcriptional regulator [Gammaproteobacteria bacterium]|nr:sigma-54-dependent Fis family transcriptional regulator [Gammaproteobacteria bacterium]